MRFWITLFLLLAVGAPPVLAADGSDCSTLPYTVSLLGRQGRVRPVWCYVLCDNDSSNDSCSEFDMDDIKSGILDVLAFELFERDNAGASGNQDGTFDCSAATVTVNTSPVTGLSSSHTNAFDLGSVTTVSLADTASSPRKLVVDQKSSPVDRYVYPTTSAVTCTNDSVDLLMIGYKEEKF